MRILIVNSWYYPNMKGGAEQSVRLLAEGLKTKGHDVAILSADAEDNGKTCDVIDKIKIYRLRTYITKKPKSLIEKIDRKLKDIEQKHYKVQINNILNDFKPSVLHTNSLSGLSLYVWEIAHFNSIPIVHTLRDYCLCSPKGILEDTMNNKFPYRFFLDYYAQQCRERTQYVDCVTAPSTYILEAHYKRGYFTSAQKETVVNAVDVDLFDVETRIKERIKRKKDTIDILFAGRLLEIKGIRLLIEAFSLMKNKRYRLIVCGEGDFDEFVKEAERKDKRILYKGNLTQEKLSEEYMNADVVVFPSLWDEPFGRIIIEANKYGVPVVASRHGGIPEIIETIGGGVIFERDTPECLADTIEKLIYSDQLVYYKGICSNLNKFSLNIQLQLFEKIYSNLLKGMNMDEI